MSIARILHVIVAHDPTIMGYQVADAIWLMLSRTSIDYTDRQPSVHRLSPVSEVLDRQQPAIDASLEDDTPLRQGAYTEGDQVRDVYPPILDVSAERSLSGTLVHLPTNSALPQATAIARALRPLRRRVLIHRHDQLDEQRTAERSAEEAMLVPVMHPMQRRWLTVHLIIDYGGASMVWQETVREFYRLLLRQGAFRDVRVWSFDSDSVANELSLFAGELAGLPHQAGELNNYEGRQLLLVVSDGVGKAWHDGRVTTLIAGWSTHNMVALCQLLPTHLWNRTALGREMEVQLYALTAGTPNSRLCVAPLDEWDEDAPRQYVPIPVVSLTKYVMTTWVHLILGRSEAMTGGYALNRTTRPYLALHRPPRERTPEQRVQRFLSLSTPTAQRLALLAAAAPVTLAILNLLCATFLPTAEQSHVAEVLLSGLLYRRSSYPDARSDTTLYEFHDGVREILLGMAPVDQSSNVVEHISRYLEQRVAQRRTMRALMNIAGTASISVFAEIRVFAHVRSVLLRGLGYVELASLFDQLGRWDATNSSNPGVTPETNVDDTSGNIIKSDSRDEDTNDTHPEKAKLLIDCRRKIEEFDNTFGWGLNAYQRQEYCDEIANMIESDADLKNIHNIILNYHTYNPLIKTLLNKDHDLHEKEWIDIGKYISNTIRNRNLNYSRDRIVSDEDMLQVVLVEILGSLSKYKYRSNFRTWIYSLAIQRIRRLHRDINASKRSANVQDIDAVPDYETILDPVYNPDSLAINRDLNNQILAALNTSQNIYLRQIMLLRLTEDLSATEIGRRLQMHPSRVRSLFALVRALLRNHPSIQSWLIDQSDTTIVHPETNRHNEDD